MLEIGDKVRVIEIAEDYNPTLDQYIGKKGTVSRIVSNLDYPYYVDFGDGCSSVPFLEQELEVL